MEPVSDRGQAVPQKTVGCGTRTAAAGEEGTKRREEGISYLSFFFFRARQQHQIQMPKMRIKPPATLGTMIQSSSAFCAAHVERRIHS